MNIFLYCNSNYREDGKRLLERFAALGLSADMTADNPPYDMVCALGGDGTLLDAADAAVRMDVPVFGINTGRVGFLAAFDRTAIDTITLEDIKGLYETRRSLLVSSKSPENDVCINEIGIFKQNVAKTIEVEVFCDNNSLGHYRCDGILVCTPTGSTAYNLSAGGPVLYPELDCCVITPICAYNTAARNMVLPLDKVITVTMSARDEVGLVVGDGKELGRLYPGDSVEIRRFDRRLRLLLSRDRQTYEIISGTVNG